MGEPRLKLRSRLQLAEANLRPRVSPPLLLKSPALFACERVFDRTARPPIRSPTNLITPRVTDASFPLLFRAMHAQGAVCYVLPKRATKPGGVAASPAIYHALDRYIDNDTRPNLDEFRYDIAEL